MNHHYQIAFVTPLLLFTAGCGRFFGNISSRDGQSARVPVVTVASAVTEQGSTLNFPVTLSAATTQAVTVSYQLNPGTAAAGVNYSGTSGTITIPAGSTSSTISVPTFEDGVDKLSSALSVTLNDVSGGTLSDSSSTAAGTITDASLYFDFTTGLVPAGATFTRASSAYAYNSAGLLASYPVDTPRFDHDPTTHTLRGLLTERNSNNQLFYSEDFSQVKWTKTNSSVASTAVVPPNGAASSFKLVEDGSTSVHSVSQASLSYTAVHPVTASVFAKAGTRTKIRIRVTDGTNGFYYDCDLSSAVVVTSAPTPAVEGSVLASGSSGTLATLQAAGVAGGAGMDDGGLGWKRCWVSGAMPSSDVSTANVSLQISLLNGATESYAGDGTSYVSLWGAEYEEALAVPTSYIVTGASGPATRSADLIAINTLGSWYNNNDFSACITYMRRWFEKPYDPNLAVSSYPIIFQFSNVAYTNHFGAQYSTDGTNLLFNWFVASSFINGATSGSPQTVQGTQYKLSLKRSASTISLAVNGSALAPGSGPVSSTSVDSVTIGSGTLPGSGLNGYIQHFSYRPRAVPDAAAVSMSQ